MTREHLDDFGDAQLCTRIGERPNRSLPGLPSITTAAFSSDIATSTTTV
jgi:hypothetical protein